VEVDSTYYALLAERNAVLWARRTPQGFIFHIKAYAMLTGHPTLIRSIPKVLREELPKELLAKAQAKEFPKEVVEAAFDMFRAALRPLKEAGRLGCLLFQFPPWFVPSAGAYAWLELVREKLPDHMLAVEFRNWRWIRPPEKERALLFLKDHALRLPLPTSASTVETARTGSKKVWRQWSVTDTFTRKGNSKDGLTR